jgi:hypothetical protein
LRGGEGLEEKQKKRRGKKKKKRRMMVESGEGMKIARDVSVLGNLRASEKRREKDREKCS